MTGEALSSVSPMVADRSTFARYRFPAEVIVVAVR
jgi:hypothetical protein